MQGHAWLPHTSTFEQVDDAKVFPSCHNPGSFLPVTTLGVSFLSQPWATLHRLWCHADLLTLTLEPVNRASRELAACCGNLASVMWRYNCLLQCRLILGLRVHPSSQVEAMLKLLVAIIHLGDMRLVERTGVTAEELRIQAWACAAWHVQPDSLTCDAHSVHRCITCV